MNQTDAMKVPDRAPAPTTPQPNIPTILWIAWFTGREMARRKWLLSLAMINLLPVMVVAAVRLWAGAEGFTAQVQLTGLSHDVYIRFLIPVMAMAVGIPATPSPVLNPWPLRISAMSLEDLNSLMGSSANSQILSLRSTIRSPFSSIQSSAIDFADDMIIWSSAVDLLFWVKGTALIPLPAEIMHDLTG